MKRAITLLLAAGMLLGGATASQAVDVKVSGNWQFGFEWAKMGQSKPKTHDSFNAVQRFRTQVDLIASESLKGVVFFEIGKSDWGKGGAGVGSDGYDVKVRYSYVDWIVPQTDLKVRMGIQPIGLPNFVAGENVLGTDSAGISLSYQFNDMVGTTFFWTRLADEGWNKMWYKDDEGVRNHDSIDAFGLVVPVKGDGFKVSPWGLFANVGRDSLKTTGSDISYSSVGLLPYGGNAAVLGTSNDNYGSAWWLGIGGELTMFNPFRIAAEFRYGSADLGSTKDITGSLGSNGNATAMQYLADRKVDKFDLDRSGWYAGLIAEYKLDFMTPGLIFWYTSGDDGNPYNGSERMPALNASASGGAGWTATNFGFDGGANVGTGRMYDAVGQTNIGTWGVVAQLKDITFLEDLKHTLKFGFYQGTNNKNMPARAGMSQMYVGDQGLYMTTKDNAWEIDFVTDYKIYKDLSVSLDLAYIRLDMDKGVWEPTLGNDKWNKREKNNYRAGVFMQYNF